MQIFWRCSLSLAACYGAIVIGMLAAISHYFQQRLPADALYSLHSSLALLAFQTLALTALSLQAPDSKLKLLVATLWQLGSWCFVYTVWAGLFHLPLYFKALAPLGGQLILLSWLLLAVTPWIRK